MINTVMKIRCRAVDAMQYKKTGISRAKWLPWQKNLILDQALNSYAKKSGGIGAANPAGSFTYCQVGTSAAAQTFQSGAITFTQTGTTITASSAFFTSAMVGALFKYGDPGTTNGAEQYIVSQTGTACVVSGAGMTVASPTLATVFLVQQTALVSPLLSTSTYQTTGSSCGTVVASNTTILQRTFNFPVQGSTYSANEIGWVNTSSLTYTFGRLILASTISIAPTQFLQVQLQITLSFTPGVPTAVANVGTAIDTAGTAMIEYFDSAYVDSSGATQNNSGAMVSSASLHMSLADYTQNSAIAGSRGAPTWPTQIGFAGAASWTYTAGSVGISTISFLTQTASTSGQTMYGIGFTNNSFNNPVFDIKLTTPFTLPTGTFQPQCVFTLVYTRTLTC